ASPRLWPSPSHSAFLQQDLTEVLQPPLRLAQAVQQRHIRNFRDARRLGAYRRLAQRISAADVHQQHPQHLVQGVETAQTLDGAAPARRTLPIRWEQPDQDLPVFIQGIHALRVRDADYDVNTYLSAYGALPPATIWCPSRARRAGFGFGLEGTALWKVLAHPTHL